MTISFFFFKATEPSSQTNFVSVKIDLKAHLLTVKITWCDTIHKLTSQERDDAICFLSYVTKGSYITSVYFGNE